MLKTPTLTIGWAQFSQGPDQPILTIPEGVSTVVEGLLQRVWKEIRACVELPDDVTCILTGLGVTRFRAAQLDPHPAPGVGYRIELCWDLITDVLRHRNLQDMDLAVDAVLRLLHTFATEVYILSMLHSRMLEWSTAVQEGIHKARYADMRYEWSVDARARVWQLLPHYTAAARAAYGVLRIEAQSDDFTACLALLGLPPAKVINPTKGSYFAYHGRVGLSPEPADDVLRTALERLIGKHADLGEIDLEPEERADLDFARAALAEYDAGLSAAPKPTDNRLLSTLKLAESLLFVHLPTDSPTAAQNLKHIRDVISQATPRVYNRLSMARNNYGIVAKALGDAH